MIKQPVYIVDVVRDVVAKVSEALTQTLKVVEPTITGVHYLVGHHTEIKARLQGLSKTTTKRFDRYPLVALFQDFEESRGDEDAYYGSARLQMMVLYHTQKEHYTEDRYEKVFKPILYPIYFELLKQLSKHRSIAVISSEQIVHDKIDRPHWGDPALYGNDGYILSDVLDGIELRDLKLIFTQTCINN